MDESDPMYDIFAEKTDSPPNYEHIQKIDPPPKYTPKKYNSNSYNMGSVMSPSNADDLIHLTQKDHARITKIDQTQYFNKAKTTNKYESDKTDEEIKIERKQYMSRGLSGLWNIGNTCYMNSIIQCLSLSSLFCSWMMDNKNWEDIVRVNVTNRLIKEYKTKNNNDELENVELTEEQIIKGAENTVIFRLAKVFTKLWGSHCTVRPTNFKKIVGKLNSEFAGYEQNDSQEFLSFILDKIHDETKRTVPLVFPNIPESVSKLAKLHRLCQEKINDPNVDLKEKAAIQKRFIDYKSEHMDDVTILNACSYYKRNFEKSYSIITQLFTGLFFSQIICKECNNKTSMFEPFTTLSIPTNESGEITLEECLDKFSATEQLTGDNCYTCTECLKNGKPKVEAEKKMYIWDLPEILIIQLKRFGMNQYGRATKTLSKVTFPINDLDLTKYLSPLNPEKNAQYDLNGISEHKGRYGSGHYIAYAKNRIKNEWYEFDDDDVTHVPNDKLNSEIVTKNAYILFYVRKLD